MEAPTDIQKLVDQVAPHESKLAAGGSVAATDDNMHR
jgi:hypothetical protein